MKSILLLNNYLTELKIAANRGQCNPAMIPMDFSDKEALVGDFANSLHVRVLNDAESQEISFCYDAFSHLLDQKAKVELVFSERESDEGGNGWLSRLSLLSEDTSFHLNVEFKAGRACCIRDYNRLGARKAFLRKLFYLSKEKDNKVFKRTEIDRSLMPSSPTVDSCLKNRNVFGLNVIDVLDTLTQKDAYAMLRNHYKEERWKNAVDLLWNDFTQSGVDSFSVYFRMKETSWLKQFTPFHDRAQMRAEGDLFKLLKTMSFIPRMQWEDNQTDIQQFSFSLLIQILREVEQSDRINDSDSYICFLDFCSDLIQDILFPPFFGHISYISSSRAVVKRLYTMNDMGSSFDRLIRRLFILIANNANIPNHHDYKPYSFVNYGLRMLGIIGSEASAGFGFEALDEGVGIKPYITLNKNGLLTSRPLSDFGYGVTQLISILLNIEVMILEQFIEHRVGEPCIIMVEEPEIHLHPRLQSLLADLFLEAYREYGIHFIIETHSEYLIRKYQYLVAGYAQNPKFGVDTSEISIYYLYDADPAKRPEGQQQVQPIVIQSDGTLDRDFGEGFSDVTTNLILDLYSSVKHHAK